MVDTADKLIINLKLYNGSAPKNKPERLFKDTKGKEERLKPDKMLSRIFKRKDGKFDNFSDSLFISGRTLLEYKIASGIANRDLSEELVDIFTNRNKTTELFSRLYQFYNRDDHKSYKSELETKVEKMQRKINNILDEDNKYRGSEYDRHDTILIENIKTILDIYLNKEKFNFNYRSDPSTAFQEYNINSFEILPATLTEQKDTVTITVALFITKKVSLKVLRFDVTFGGDIKGKEKDFNYVSHRKPVYFIDNYMLKDKYITQLLKKLQEKGLKEDKAQNKKDIKNIKDAELINAKKDIFLKPELMVKLLKIIMEDPYAIKDPSKAAMIENNAKIISKIFFPLNTKLSIHGNPYIIEKFEFVEAKYKPLGVKHILFDANLIIDVYAGDKVLTKKELYKRSCMFKAKELDDIATELLPKNADGTSPAPIDFFLRAYRVKGVKNIASKKKKHYDTKLERLEALQKAGRKSRKSRNSRKKV